MFFELLGLAECAPSEIAVPGVPQTAVREPLEASRGIELRGGVSARIFRMLNEVAIEAIETGAEQITAEALERYKPVGEDEAAFQ